MVIISIVIFGAANYYIGLRGWQKVGNLLPFMNNKVYWAIFWVLALSYVAARIGEKYIPGRIEGYLNLIGAYWMAAMLYFLIILPVIDITAFAGRKLTFIPQGMRGTMFLKTYSGVLVLLIVAGLLIYGTWNARNLKVTHYDIDINKSAGNLKELHAVMISDAHLGSIVDSSRLNKMVDRINELNPDIVFMAGDIVDEKLAPFLKQNMGEIFKKLKTKHGVYAVTGNHEFYGGEVDDIVKNLEMSGIKVLRDDNVKVADSFYVTGREDISIESYYKKKRKSVSEILANADKELPVILLDHNPRDLEEPKESGVDLQLSGHTHRGQMFPNEYFTKRLYELDWGYLKKDNFNIIVSSGIGTWGPPIRIGNSAEIVDVTIRFLK
jgi:predicted MPP superfamily phosphohydrolase